MPTIVHFDIATDEPQRAKSFYESLFNWKLDTPPGMEDYFLFDTAGLDGKPGPGGGLGRKGDPSQKITVYIGVDDIDAYLAKVVELGGMVVAPRSPVPGWGHLATCVDTEGNVFGLWQDDSSAQ